MAREEERDEAQLADEEAAAAAEAGEIGETVRYRGGFAKFLSHLWHWSEPRWR